MAADAPKRRGERCCAIGHACRVDTPRSSSRSFIAFVQVLRLWKSSCVDLRVDAAALGIHATSRSFFGLRLLELDVLLTAHAAARTVADDVADLAVVSHVVAVAVFDGEHLLHLNAYLIQYLQIVAV